MLSLGDTSKKSHTGSETSRFFTSEGILAVEDSEYSMHAQIHDVTEHAGIFWHTGWLATAIF